MSMITSESFWLVELTMDDTAIAKPHSLAKTTTKKRSKQNQENGEDDDTEEEECDVEVWETLTKSFRQVQTVHQNRTLIQQVNENHQSRIPDNLAKNVGLFREINGNITKVLSIYSDLSLDFANIVRQRCRIAGSNSRDDKVESAEP